MQTVIQNEIPEFFCYSCEDYGLIPHFHPSTDGLIGYTTCPMYHGTIWKWDLNTKFPSTISDDNPPF